MRRLLIFAAILWPCAIRSGPVDRAPVLVELFTSEGCSSCPPADRLLQQLDPHVIVLSEHVDYWDHDGWKDPHSSHELTLRQQDYATRFRIPGPYTPQMVIDGSVEFNGSNAPKAQSAIAQQSQKPKVNIRLALRDGSVEVKIEASPAAGDVMLAIADDHGASDVRAGENKGLRMEHVAIVRSLRKVGSVKRGAGFEGNLKLPGQSAGERIIVFLQQSAVGPVAGVAELGPN
jgi:hypothetical protein